MYGAGLYKTGIDQTETLAPAAFCTYVQECDATEAGLCTNVDFIIF